MAQTRPDSGVNTRDVPCAVTKLHLRVATKVSTKRTTRKGTPTCTNVATTDHHSTLSKKLFPVQKQHVCLVSQLSRSFRHLHGDSHHDQGFLSGLATLCTKLVLVDASVQRFSSCLSLFSSDPSLFSSCPSLFSSCLSLFSFTCPSLFSSCPSLFSSCLYLFSFTCLSLSSYDLSLSLSLFSSLSPMTMTMITRPLSSLCRKHVP